VRYQDSGHVVSMVMIIPNSDILLWQCASSSIITCLPLVELFASLACCSRLPPVDKLDRNFHISKRSGRTSPHPSPLSSHYLFGRYVVTFSLFCKALASQNRTLCSANENVHRLANVVLTTEEYGLSQAAQKRNPNLLWYRQDGSAILQAVSQIYTRRVA
jgi:hypothetical protein